MDFTTFEFFLFFALVITSYYLVHEKYRWYILLAASLIFIADFQPLGLVFLIFSAWTIWYAAQKIAVNHQKGRPAARNKRIVSAVIWANLLILIILKYAGTYIGDKNNIENPLAILMPIGLSYYTLQAIGYILDVYWNRIDAEQNFFKVLLFLSYFPQMLQGPISRYKDLSNQLYKKTHSLNFKNIKHGALRILWGFLKVRMIAENTSLLVEALIYEPANAYGLTVFFGLCFFGLELYCNFSGGIDIVIGASECLGISLPENFRQPFFSTSLGDFWRRWHITLGTWMKDYVFYPFSMSRGVNKYKKCAKKYISKKTVNKIAIAAANVFVFLLVGIWHGFGTNYALWGLYNGIILGVSVLLADVYRAAKVKCRINETSKSWHLFCVFRTFIIVTIGWCTDCTFSAGEAVLLIRDMFWLTRSNLLSVISNSLIQSLFVVVPGVLLLLFVSVMEERGKKVSVWLDGKNWFLQALIWTILLHAIIIFGSVDGTGGFLYADF